MSTSVLGSERSGEAVVAGRPGAPIVRWVGPRRSSRATASMSIPLTNCARCRWPNRVGARTCARCGRPIVLVIP